MPHETSVIPALVIFLGKWQRQRLKNAVLVLLLFIYRATEKVPFKKNREKKTIATIKLAH